MEISTTEARGEFAEMVNRAAYGKERVVLTKHGRRLVALIPVEDLEVLERLEDKADAETVRRAYAEQGSEQPESWADVKARLGLGRRRKEAPRRHSTRRRKA